jgi:hypothetical protein
MASGLSHSRAPSPGARIVNAPLTVRIPKSYSFDLMFVRYHHAHHHHINGTAGRAELRAQ